MNSLSPVSDPTRARILIVDDCATSRMMQQLILQRGRFEILLASNGEQAIEMAGTLAPDLVVLDLQMPGLSGMTALRELKRIPGTRGIPVIMLTVSGDADVRREALESGCGAFLTKPVEAESLFQSVEEVLLASRARGDGR
jgi:CheY-like chemotaxis protein